MRISSLERWFLRENYLLIWNVRRAGVCTIGFEIHVERFFVHQLQMAGKKTLLRNWDAYALVDDCLEILRSRPGEDLHLVLFLRIRVQHNYRVLLRLSRLPGPSRHRVHLYFLIIFINLTPF